MGSGPTVSHCAAGQWASRPDTSGTAQVSETVAPPCIIDQADAVFEGNFGGDLLTGVMVFIFKHHIS